MALNDKMQVRKEYKKELLNEENACSGKVMANKNQGPCEKVLANDVVKALYRTKAKNKEVQVE